MKSKKKNKTTLFCSKKKSFVLCSQFLSVSELLLQRVRKDREGGKRFLLGHLRVETCEKKTVRQDRWGKKTIQ